jgi:hypothetical protein
VFKFPDRPDGDWPIVLCQLCAGILGFLGLWLAAKVIVAASCGAPAADRDEDEQGGSTGQT